MPKVFVGIPTFNRPDMVRDAIDSVRAQTFNDFRAVVSDNCSSGDAGHRIRAYVEKLGDERITFHQQERNEGEYGQGWYFFRESRDCPLFVTLHDDDMLDPDCLANAVATLDAHPELAFYVSNAVGMNAAGMEDAALTSHFMRIQGRTAAVEGPFDVLAAHLRCGFAPISATVFRRDALERSGYVDPDLRGNYPFEANIFLRLGEAGARAWFSPLCLWRIRFHGGSIRGSYLRNPTVVENCIKLWRRRHFAGWPERRRRKLLARYRRADAIIRLRSGDFAAARHSLADALRDNPLSIRSWSLAPAILLAPRALRAVLGKGIA